MKFTDLEINLLQEMIDFPSSYKLTDLGLKTIKSILDKAMAINESK